MQETYIVTGMHRSGTSCVAELLASSGLYAGNDLIEAAPDNPRGFFEDRSFVGINEKALGGEEGWLKIVPGPCLIDHSKTTDAATMLLDNMRIAAKGRGLMLKDPRVCRLLPFWLNLSKQSKVIYCVRSPMAVAESLHKRNNLTFNHALCLWYAYNVELIDSLIKNDVNNVVINYDSLVNGDQNTFQDLSGFLNKEIDSKVVDVAMNHAKATLDEYSHLISPVLSEKVSHLWCYLSGITRIEKNTRLPELKDFLKTLEIVECERLASIELLNTNRLSHDEQLKKSAIYNQHLEKDIELLKNQLIENESQHNYLQSTLRDELSKATGYVKLLESDISDQKLLLNESTNQQGALRDELNKAAEYVKHLESDISGQKLLLNESTNQQRVLRDELNKAAEYAKHLESDIFDQKLLLNESTSQQRVLRDYIFDQKLMLNESADNIRCMEKNKVELLSIKDALSEENSQLHSQVANLKQNIESQSLTLNEWGRYIPHVERDIDLLKHAIDSQQGEFQKFKKSPILLFFTVFKALFWQVRNLPSTIKSYCGSTHLFFKKKLTSFYKAYYRSMVLWGDSLKNGKVMQKMVLSRQTLLSNFHQRHNSQKMDSLPSITLSVVTYNNGRWIEGFMASLVNQLFDLQKINVHFVDNDSTDDTWLVLNSTKNQYGALFASFELSQQPNKGFGAGHDVVMQQSTTDLVLIANIDLEFEANSILLCVSCAVTDFENVASWEFRQQPYEHPKFVDPVTLAVNWSSHACILIRKSAYQAVGGYEKRIFMYGEDVELSYRFRRDGWLLRYVPSAVVLHHTYAHEAEVKPLQFLGSAKANLLIRCRYGDFRDVVAGFMQYLYLGYKDTGFEGSAQQVRSALPEVLWSAIAMLTSRKKSAEFFPFRGFDYDMVRDGAFHTHKIDFDSLPLVSVITRTVEGRDGLLRQAIASVRNQTYPNIEHVVVQDGGDSACKIVSDYSKGEVFGYEIRFFECPKKGRSYAGNQGMAKAKGKYLVLLDDDDLLFPDHVEQLVAAIEKHTVSAAYSLSWEVHTKMRDKMNGDYLEFSHATPSVFRQDFCRKTLSHHNYIPIQSILFDTKLFEEYGGFEEGMECLEDWVLWKKYALDNDFVFVPKTTSMFRTPADLEEREQRGEYFNQFYEDASKMYCYEEKLA